MKGHKVKGHKGHRLKVKRSKSKVKRSRSKVTKVKVKGQMVIGQ